MQAARGVPAPDPEFRGGSCDGLTAGSLIARIIFQPVEETLRLYWSRSLLSTTTIPLLEFALRLSLHLLLLFPVFLIPLLPSVLPLLLPRKYTAETTAAATLQTYLVAYLPLLSLNGILEAFHAASASPAQIAQQAWVMGASSVTFIGALWYLTAGAGIAAGAGASYTREQALIYASCASMLVRIAYAGTHAATFARKRGERLSALPRLPVLAAVGLAGAVVWGAAARLGGGGLRDTLALLGVGGVAGLCVLGAM